MSECRVYQNQQKDELLGAFIKSIKMEEEKDFKHLVRIANTDLKGEEPLYKGLTKIKGVGFIFANAVATAAGIKKKQKIGELTAEEIKKLSLVIKDPLKAGIPEWAFNRRKDPESGDNIHLTGADLEFAKENDIKLMKKIKSYKGVRHIQGLPVRGQKTKSNFRKNKGNVLGVKRKSGAKAGRV